MMAPPKDPTFEIDNVKGDYNMATKELNARIPQKHDTETNWNKAENFRPMAGEVIVYDPDANYSYARFKIGDGNTVAKDLPFYSQGITDVTTLPTENFNENTIYRVEHKKQGVKIYVIGLTDTAATLEEVFSIVLSGVNCVITITVVDQLPDTMEPFNIQDGIAIIPVYVLNDTGVGYLSTPDGEVGTVSTALGFDPEEFGDNLEHGWSDNILSETEAGVYSVRVEEITYTYHIFKDDLSTELVQAIEGKGLSTNDFTDEDKNTLYSLLGKYSRGLSYIITEEGTCEIISIGVCTDTDIVIPRLLDGYPVTSIGDYAFSGYDSLTSVTIPDSVTSIGIAAFQYTSLTSVTIPDSVTSISDEVFAGCESLTSITIPDSVTSIGNFAFQYCSSLMSITIPDRVTSIGSQAFAGCESLTSIAIPDSVTSIGVHAFNTNGLKIYCEATEMPVGWDSKWFSEDDIQVIWGVALDFVGVNEKIGTLETELKTYIDETILGGKW